MSLRDEIASKGGARKVRALTFKQAHKCENAISPPSKCRCRCGGACHGRARIVNMHDKLGFQELPPDDPHRLGKPGQSNLV